MMQSYDDFLPTKIEKALPKGLSELPELPSFLFPHQRDTVNFLLAAGRGAAFLDTGLGKTACELVYSDVVVRQTNMPVLLLAPLAVGKQHEREAKRFNIDAQVIRSGAEVNGARIYITNYDRLHLFDK